MSALSPLELVAYARQAGFSEDESAKMAAIAMAESSGRLDAHNPNRSTGDDSYGLWQINMIDSLGPERRRQFGIQSNEELFDPAVNARAAKAIRDSQGFNAWSVHRSGAYERFLPDAQQALGRLRGGETPQLGAGAGSSGGGASSRDPLSALLSGALDTSLPSLGAVGGAPTATAAGLAAAATRGFSSDPVLNTAALSLGRGPALAPGSRQGTTRMAGGQEFVQGMTDAAQSRPLIASALSEIDNTSEAAIKALFPAAAGATGPGSGSPTAPLMTDGGGERVGIVDVGKALKQAGLDVGEQSAFGPVGVHSPESLHGEDLALDIRDRAGGEADPNWRRRTQFLGEQAQQILGGSAEIFHPGNDPRGHGTHFHLGLPSGGVTTGQLRAILAAREESLRRFPMR